MRRYISLFCIALVLVMCMVSPVSADGFDSYFLNVLDFSFPNAGTSRIVNITNATRYVTFLLPENLNTFYLDSVISIHGDIPRAVYISNGGTSNLMSLSHIGNDLYRVYGNLSGLVSSFIAFEFDGISSTSVTFESVQIATQQLSNYDVPLEGSGSYPGGTFDMSKNYGDNRPTKTTIVNSDIDDRSFILYLYSHDWRKYDFLEFQCYFIVDSIDSISCVMGSQVIPFEVSYFGNDAYDSDLYVTIRIDCRYLDKTVDDYPMIIINGKVIFDGVSLVSLMNSNGVVLVNSVSSLTYLFTNIRIWIESQTNFLISEFTQLKSHLSLLNEHIHNWIDSQTSSVISEFTQLKNFLYQLTAQLEAAIRGDTTPGNSFQQQVNQKDQQLNDMAAVMESVDQPDINSVNVSANTYVDGTVLAASMSGITSVFSQGLFFDLIVMSIMMATAGYVLFGKR